MYQYSLRAILPYLHSLPAALAATIELTVLATILSGIVGIGGALVRQSRNALLRGIGGAYVEIIRNMPLLVLAYLIYFGLPEIGLLPSSFISALIAMTLNSGAFMTEIFRAGLIAVPKGQYEAARSQGMTAVQTFRFVVLAQILRTSYAPLGNQLIGVIMASSIASVIAVDEVTSWTFNTGSDTYRYFETFSIAGLVYFALCQATNFIRIIFGRYLFRAAAAGGQW